MLAASTDSFSYKAHRHCRNQGEKVSVLSWVSTLMTAEVKQKKQDNYWRT